MTDRPRLLRDGIPRSVALWLLAVFTILLAVLFWASARDVRPPDPGPLSYVRGEAGPGRFELVPIAGEPVPVDEAVLVVVADGERDVVPLRSLVGTGIGPTWDPGERVCIVGPGPSCLHAAAGSVSVRVLVDGLPLHESSVAFTR